MMLTSSWPAGISISLEGGLSDRMERSTLFVGSGGVDGSEEIACGEACWVG